MKYFSLPVAYPSFSLVVVSIYFYAGSLLLFVIRIYIVVVMIALRGWSSHVTRMRIGHFSVVVRHQSSSVELKITKQLTFYSGDKSNSNHNTNGDDGGEAPIVVLYGWLLATNKALKRFVDYYVGRGCDVLTVRTSPTEFMWPSRAQRIVDDMFSFVAEDHVKNRSRHRDGPLVYCQS